MVGSDDERRQFFRIPTRIAAKYAARIDVHQVELKKFDAVILEISGGGMLIQARQWVPVTSRLRLCFALKDEPGEFDVQADVRAVRQAQGQHTYRIHCQFLELARADAERIVRWTFREQIAQRRRNGAA